MFDKLLALLISNVLVSFSVLLCYRSLTSICRLKGENDLKWKFGVPASALEPSRQNRVRLHASAQSQDRAQLRSSALHVSLLPYLHRICVCAMGLLSGYICSSALTCDRAHMGLCLSALTCDRAHPCDRQHIIFVINRTLSHFCKVTLGGIFQEPKTLCLSLLSLPFVIYFISLYLFMLRG